MVVSQVYQVSQHCLSDKNGCVFKDFHWLSRLLRQSGICRICFLSTVRIVFGSHLVSFPLDFIVFFGQRLIPKTVFKSEKPLLNDVLQVIYIYLFLSFYLPETRTRHVFSLVSVSLLKISMVQLNCCIVYNINRTLDE